MGDEDNENAMDKKKPHRERSSGRKAEKKKLKKQHNQELTDRQRNPKAFTFKSAFQAERRFRRKQDLVTKKQHIPVVDRNPVEPPPILVVVVGPPKVGKTTLIHNLVKHFAKQPLSAIKGPVTVVTGKRQRVTFMECNNDINSMMDLGKVADLVLLLVDASFGFEMEIFEFLNICQVHGMPRILGVLTHLDLLKNNKQLKKTKKTLKHRFWTEVYAGAKLFYLSGILHGEYLKNDIRNLGRFISVIKFRPLVWRTNHPYILVDRLEDITDPEKIRQNFKCDRNICLYGFVRGVAFNKENSIHIPGCGDTKIKNINFLPDPCPLPEKKKRSLLERERTIYAPFSGVGGVVYDKDAVYVEMPGTQAFQEKNAEEAELVSSILATQITMDAKRNKSKLKIFSNSEPIVAEEFENTSKINEKEIKFRPQNNEKVKESAMLTDDYTDTDSSEEDDSEEKLKGNQVTSDIKNMSFEKVEAGGRIRRKVIFKDEINNAQKQDNDNSIQDLNNSNDKDNQKKDLKSKNLEKNNIKSKIEIALKRIQDKEFVSENTKFSGKEKEYDDDDDDDDDDDVDDYDDDYDDDYGNGDSDYKNDNDDDDDDDDNYDYEGGGSGDKINFDNCSNSNDKEKEKVKDFRMKENDEKFEGLETTLAQKRKRESQINVKIKKVKENETLFSSEESAVKWKENLAQKAADAFIERQNNSHNLYKLVYGNTQKMLSSKSNLSQDKEEDQNAEEIGGIFHIVSEKQRLKIAEKEQLDEKDSSIFKPPLIRDWTSDEMNFLIKDCFVTGKWSKSEDAEELLKLDDMSDPEFGDFEDLEGGKKHGEKIAETKDEILEKKKKLKEKFDAEYDEKEEYSYYTDLKAQVDQQSQLNKSEFEGLADDFRVELEGYRPGMYVRLELDHMAYELVENFDPTYPLIIGGLLPIEENIGFIQVRLKKHRWYSKILKTKDPLIVSLGWRRFQTLVVFSKFEDNMRQRMLKYTPEHVSCMGHFYGPITPQGTGFLAVQDVATQTPGFRVACTGAVVEIDKSTTITKKLKLVGTPLKIYKKTAFIQGMFNSILEVGRFEGAKIRTVSGIRGQIKKALPKPEGAFRATFEDKIKLSDIIFCRTWYVIDVPKFYNPMTTLLLSSEKKSMWQGMKTLGQLKRERNLKNEVQQDSLYTPIQRKIKEFKPLKIPKTLQKALPYKDKPKNLPRNKKSKESERVAVIKEPYEEKVASLMKMVKANFQQKKLVEKKAMIERVKKHRAEKKVEKMRQLRKNKELKKHVFRTLGKMEKNKNKRFSNN